MRVGKKTLCVAAAAISLVALWRSCAPVSLDLRPSGEGLFGRPLRVRDGLRFGRNGEFTFELFRGGIFLVDGVSGYAWQKSDSYRDSAIIRSTQALPSTYRVAVEAGEIEYDLANIIGLDPDPDYKEGPQNENGCYLIAITDEPPAAHYTNDWWHRHRKLVIDIDNNVWGSGMPNPIFMVYFDAQNKLVSFDGKTNRWENAWRKGVQYEKGAWYRAEVAKTPSLYILSVFDGQGRLLKTASVEKEKVWHADSHPDYLVTGDPHENYYQGSMKIRSVEISAGGS
ncbi:MAG: hypothetical protein NC819_02030 [Candidatus Omnitrophica bacterium]|nr:hypothetical protein [Candidatus Omnitrophota bacterium]